MGQKSKRKITLGHWVTRRFRTRDSTLLGQKQKKASVKKSSLKEKISFLQSAMSNPAQDQALLVPHSSPIRADQLVRPNEDLAQSIESFLLDQRSIHTKNAYAKDLKRFVKFLLVKTASQESLPLDRAIVVSYKDQLLSEGLEHTTVDRHLATLRSFFSWLMQDGKIQTNPAEHVRFLKPKRLSTTLGFSDDEVRRVLSIPNRHSKIGTQHSAILHMLFYCGLRRSELCELRTTQLGVERGVAVLRVKGKGNRERILPLIEPVQRAILHYLKLTGRTPTRDLPLFSRIKGELTSAKMQPLDPSMIFYIVRKYAKKAGIMHRVSPHSCRATAISNARDHNVSDRAIQEFAGWASPEMITRYDKRKTAIEQSAAHAISYELSALPVETEEAEAAPLLERAGS